MNGSGAIAACLWMALTGAPVAADAPRGSSEGSAATVPSNTAAKIVSVAGWSLLAEGGAEGKVVADPGRRREESTGTPPLKLQVMRVGDRCGIVNPHLADGPVREGHWYDVTFLAHTGPRENNRGYGLTVSLESRDGETVCARTTIPEVGGEWTRYTLALAAHGSDPRPRLVITLSEPGTIWLNDVEVSPRSDKGTR